MPPSLLCPNKKIYRQLWVGATVLAHHLVAFTEGKEQPILTGYLPLLSSFTPNRATIDEIE